MKRKQRGEGIDMNNHVLKSDFAHYLFLPIGQADLPPRRHFHNQHLDAWMETVGVEELLQKGVVDIVVRLLEVIVQFDDILLLFLLHQIRGNILDDGLFASLGSPVDSVCVQ